MTEPHTQPEFLSRPALIVALRNELNRRANGEMSICKLAAEKGIFCKGFHRYSGEELKSRFSWIAEKNPDASREELEELADRWQMARQDVVGTITSCDTQQLERDMCGGWEEFSNEELAGFLAELTGRKVSVSPSTIAPEAAR